MKALRDWIDESKADIGAFVLLVTIGFLCGINSAALCVLTRSMDTLQAEIRLNDQNAARRAEELQKAMADHQEQLEAMLMKHSTPIQLGSLSEEDVARLNIQLATAIAANQGCYVTINCEPTN